MKRALAAEYMALSAVDKKRLCARHGIRMGASFPKTARQLAKCLADRPDAAAALWADVRDQFRFAWQTRFAKRCCVLAGDK